MPEARIHRVPSFPAGHTPAVRLRVAGCGSNAPLGRAASRLSWSFRCTITLLFAFDVTPLGRGQTIVWERNARANTREGIVALAHLVRLPRPSRPGPTVHTPPSTAALHLLTACSCPAPPPVPRSGLAPPPLQPCAPAPHRPSHRPPPSAPSRTSGPLTPNRSA